MKKLFLLTLVIAFIVSCTSDPKYVVQGEVEGMEEGMAYLQKRESGEFVILDSAMVEEGTFELSGGSVDYPETYYLSLSGKRGYLMLFLENAKINISGHADSLTSASITGSTTQDQYDDYNEGLQPFYERNRELYEAMREAQQSGQEEEAKKLEEERNQLFDEMEEYNISFIKSNPQSYATPVVLRSISYGLSGEEIEAYIAELDPKLMETQIIIDLNERVEKLKKVAIGQIAPDFTQNDPEGNPVSLSEVLGPELLLIDFWAAWCGPCRAENPNVVAVYNEFHDKGFDVLGVSLDRDKDDWLKAIEDDELTWTHVSDLKYWENEAAQLYAVNAIPANFLLDSEGRILASNVRGPELREKVAEILGE